MDRKVKIGVFGCSRGKDYLKNLKYLENVEIAAICEKKEQRLAETKEKFCPETTRTYTDFDEFLKEDLDGIVFANYFHEHTPFAIKAMEKGIAVLSETTPASTMKECVELVRAVERTGAKYMFAENYPFFAANQEMKRLYETGDLGRVLFAEGEYVHPMSKDELNLIGPGWHWRAWLPRTYYLTHALGPLVYITGEMPKTVNALTAPAPELFVGTERKNKDAASIILGQTESGAIFQFGGTAGYAPHGNWYRIACTKGGAESVRGDEGSVRVGYNWWSHPENAKEGTYKAEWDADEELRKVADQAGHNGGDFWVCYNFIRYITDGVEPFFNVYRGTQMSAIAILAWRSSLENGKQYEVPDFRLEADRIKYENDDASPFPGAANQSVQVTSRPDLD